MLTELVDILAFDWSSLPRCGFFEILGKRGTGKTTWAQFALQHSPTRTTGNFIIMCGSEVAKTSWSKIVHPLFIYDVSETHLEGLRDTQNEAVKQHTKLQSPVPENRHITLILDDVASNKKLMRSQILAYLASNSRHLQMCIYVLAQYHCQIVTEVRNQFDMVFMLNTQDTKSITRIHSEYCSSIDLRIFRHVLNHITKDFGMLVIDNQSASTCTNEICFYAKMAEYPPLLEPLGCRDGWDFGQAHHWDESVTRPNTEEADTWSQQQNDVVITDKKGKLIIRKQ